MHFGDLNTFKLINTLVQENAIWNNNQFIFLHLQIHTCKRTINIINNRNTDILNNVFTNNLKGIRPIKNSPRYFTKSTPLSALVTSRK